jgi:hypothetical protein
MRIAAAHQVRKIEHVLRFDGEHAFDDVVHQRDVAAEDLDFTDQIRVIRGEVGVDVKGGDFMATREQLSQNPITDEARAAEDQNSHGAICTLRAHSGHPNWVRRTPAEGSTYGAPSPGTATRVTSSCGE